MFRLFRKRDKVKPPKHELPRVEQISMLPIKKIKADVIDTIMMVNIVRSLY